MLNRYQVTIDGSSFTDPSPANGFIDPMSIDQYRTRRIRIGSVSAPTVTSGDVLRVNDVDVPMVGTNLASIINSINAYTHLHNVIASNQGGNLGITMAIGFIDDIPSISDGTTGITAALGFVNPTLSAIPAFPSLSDTLAKNRANIRWQNVIDNIKKTVNIVSLRVISNTGGAVNSAPSSVVFQVAFDRQYYAYDSNGDILFAEDAIRNVVANAMTQTKTQMMTYFDPTVVAPATRPLGQTNQKVTAGALTNNFSSAISALVVNELP